MVLCLTMACADCGASGGSDASVPAVVQTLSCEAEMLALVRDKTLTCEKKNLLIGVLVQYNPGCAAIFGDAAPRVTCKDGGAL